MTTVEGRADVAATDVSGRRGGLTGRLVSVLAVVGPLLVYAAVALWMFRGNQTFGMEFDEVFRVNNLVAVQHPGALPVQPVHLVRGRLRLVRAADVQGLHLERVPDLVPAARTVRGPARRDPDAVHAGSDRRRLGRVPALQVPRLLGGGRDSAAGHGLPVALPGDRLRVRRRAVHDPAPGGRVVLPAVHPARAHARHLRDGSQGSRSTSRSTRPGCSRLSASRRCASNWPTVRTVVTSWRNLAASALALAIGCFNYVYYNVTAGFPSLRPLVNRFFFPDEYAANPIDYKKSNGVLGDAAARLPLVWDLLGAAAWFVAGALVLAVVVTVVSFVRSVRAGRLRVDRLLYVPLVALGIAFVAIIVSPNTTRRGHYGMLVGLMEAAAVAAVILALRFLPQTRPALLRGVAVVLFVVYFAVTAGVSRASVDRKLESGGTGFFSSAIFDLYDHVTGDGGPTDPLLQTQWGSYAQFYFLSDGRYSSPNVVFDVLGAPDDAARAQVVADAARAAGGTVVIPVYTTVPPVNGVDAVALLEDVAANEDGSLCTVEVFTDLKDREQIRLFRLDLDGEGSTDALARCDAA